MAYRFLFQWRHRIGGFIMIVVVVVVVVVVAKSKAS
jgi:hypothetical protein